MKKKLLTLLQFAIGAGLLTFIFARLNRSGDLVKLGEGLRQISERWPLLVLAVLLVAGCILLCVQRWNLLLKAQGCNLPFRRVVALSFVGQFFNAFMFGSTGGDVFKAIFVASETHHRRAEVTSTVFIDRIVGLLGLVLLTGIIAIVRLPVFLSSRPMQFALGVIVFQFVGTTAGMVTVLRKNAFEHYPMFRRLEERTKLGQILSRSYSAFQFCMKDKVLLARTMTLSLLNHVCMLVATHYLGLSLGLRLDFIDYATVFPAINAVAAMPITPGGLGTREWMSLHLLGPFGITQAQSVTLSLLLYCTLLFWSLMGGVVYFFYIYLRGKRALAVAATEEE